MNRTLKEWEKSQTMKSHEMRIKTAKSSLSEVFSARDARARARDVHRRDVRWRRAPRGPRASAARAVRALASPAAAFSLRSSTCVAKSASSQEF